MTKSDTKLMLFILHTEYTQCKQTFLTFSTSVGLAIAEDITPDTTPHIILIKRVSSVKRNKEKKGLLIRGTEKRVSEKRVLSYQRKGRVSTSMSSSLSVRHGVHILLSTKTKSCKLFCPGAGLRLVGKPAVTLTC